MIIIFDVLISNSLLCIFGTSDIGHSNTEIASEEESYDNDKQKTANHSG